MSKSGQPSTKLLPLVIAHRGASGYAPENTLAAFRKAVEMGCQMIELDVRLTADHVPVVIHDGSLARITGDPRRVEQLTIAQLKALDAGAWLSPQFQGEQIPTLVEVLETVPRTVILNLELKPAGPGKIHLLTEKVYDVIAEHGAEPRVVCTSFAHKALWALRRRCHNLPIGYLAEGRLLPEQMTEAKGLRVVALILQARWTTPALVRWAHTNRLKVYAYTVNRPLQMRQLLRRGVDGLMTNFPDRLVHAVAQLYNKDQQESRQNLTA